ncbi:MAG: hypothetical protein IT158_00455 [Bryobacterales bacterium]|nr:hypothetical protein [Bryobacterales bacterium]
MQKTKRKAFAPAAYVLLAGLLGAGWRSGGRPIAAWEAGFRDPGPEHSMGVYWWWFGPSQTRDEIRRELEVMRAAHIRRALIYPIYPIAADDPAKGIRNYAYLSTEFLEAAAYASETARRMGMEIDVPLGSGWPYGGPWITPRHAAKRLRAEVRSVRPGEAVAPVSLDANERLAASVLVRGDGQRVEPASARNAAGMERVPADLAGPHVLVRFIQMPTGMQVKRPALGGEGLVLDHLNKESLAVHLKAAGEPLRRALPAVRAFHCDSMEVYGQNWTDGFLEEFAKRRGYDLTLYLPALFLDAGSLGADVRYDFWRTVGDLVLDNYSIPLAEWCRRKGALLQMEAYGTPALDMRSFAHAGSIMGESYDWKTFVASRWASSAAHQNGARTTSAEAWTWLRRPRYLATLEDLKTGADLHFACGVNKIIAHGFAYSPPPAGIPGWGYYASVMLNDNHPLWPYFPKLSDYVRRASYALSLGKPAVDVALYLPEEDVMAERPLDSGKNLYAAGLNLYMESKYRLGGGPTAEFSLPAAYKSESPVIRTLIASGFTFDGIDTSILREGLRAAAGRLEIGDAAYRIVVLPGLTGISLPLLERVAEFCRSGGTVIATRRLPSRVYGVRHGTEETDRARQIVREMFNAERRYGKGTAILAADETAEFGRALAAAGPQVRFDGLEPDLVMVQRREGDRNVYFLANTSGREKRVRAVFRDGKGRARLWNAETGAVTDAVRPGNDLELTLEPFGSVFVAFDGTASGEPPARQAAKREAAALPITGPWSFSARGRSPVTLGELKSWTELPAYRYFSGSADYTAAVEIGREFLAGGRSVQLELGTVHEVAEVWINGRHAGVSWKSPRRLDVSGLLKAGRNELKIRVANLPVNHVLGQPDPDYSRLEQPLRFPYPEEKKQVREPAASGLLGPARLRAFED